ncbi:hypothetical protein [Leptolyngbya sp. O-77]|nr:hypothetical protein [Leptolyngbya sp. O-77]
MFLKIWTGAIGRSPLAILLFIKTMSVSGIQHDELGLNWLENGSD